MKNRPSQKPSTAPEPAKSGGAKEVAFSVRLTAEEHELLKQAAAARGWTPTNLIRTATLERAKHILNTSRVTSFNFKGLGIRIADQLFKPRTYDVRLAEGDHARWTVQMTHDQLQDLESRDPHDTSIVVGVNPRETEFAVDVLSELRLAAKYGGGEFLNLILEFCEGLTASKRTDLPPPLDPS